MNLLKKKTYIFLGDLGLKESAESAVQLLFKDYSRVVAVVFFWNESHRHLDGHPLVQLAKFRELPNDKSPYFDPINEKLIRSWKETKSRRAWVSLRDIASSLLG